MEAHPVSTESVDPLVNGQNEDASNLATETEDSVEREVVKKEADNLTSECQEPESAKSEPAVQPQPPAAPSHDQQHSALPPPLRRPDSRHYSEAGHPQQPHYQPQNWPRAQPHHQLRPQQFLAHFKQPPPPRPEYSQYQHSENLERKKSVTFNSALHSEGQGPHLQNNPQPNRLPPQGGVRRPSPWAILKEKLPAETRGRPPQGDYSQLAQIRQGGPNHDHPSLQRMQNNGENVPSPNSYQHQRSSPSTGPQTPIPHKGPQDAPNGCRSGSGGEQQARPHPGYPPSLINSQDPRTFQRQASSDRFPPFPQRPDSALRSPHPDPQYRSPSPNLSANKYPFEQRAPIPVPHGFRPPAPKTPGEDDDSITSDSKQAPLRFGPPQSRPQSGVGRLPYPQGAMTPPHMNMSRPQSAQSSPSPGAQLRRDPSLTSLDGRATPNTESRPQSARPSPRSVTPIGGERTQMVPQVPTPSPQTATHNYGRQTSLSSLQEEAIAGKGPHHVDEVIKSETSATPTGQVTPSQVASREHTPRPPSVYRPPANNEHPKPPQNASSSPNIAAPEALSRLETGDTTSHAIAKLLEPTKSPVAPPEKDTTDSYDKTSRPDSIHSIVDDEKSSHNQMDEETISSPFPDSVSKSSSAKSRENSTRDPTPNHFDDNELITDTETVGGGTAGLKVSSEFSPATENTGKESNTPEIPSESFDARANHSAVPDARDIKRVSVPIKSDAQEGQIEMKTIDRKITSASDFSAPDTATVMNSKHTSPSPVLSSDSSSKDILERSNSRTESLPSRTSTERNSAPENRSGVSTPLRLSASSKGSSEEQLKRPSSLKKPSYPILKDGVQENRIEEAGQKKSETVSNGTHASPSKSPTKLPTPKKMSTPSPLKSPSKPGTKTPEMPSTAEKKKVPMNKIQVGAAPSPNLKVVKSKVGSLDNTSYKPGGGHVKIENRKLDFSKTQPKIAAKNDTYTPGGGDKKQIQQVKLQWNAKPKVGSLENAAHKPGGGDKKIETVKLDFKEKAKPKVGSKDNIKHTPGGGSIKNTDEPNEENQGEIEDQKLEIKAQSKIGSLDNVKYKPGGGDKKIFDDKEYLKQMCSFTGEHSSSQEHISKISGRNKSSDRKSIGSSSKSYEELREEERTKPTDQNFNQLSDKVLDASNINTEIARNFDMEERFNKNKLEHENKANPKSKTPPRQLSPDKNVLRGASEVHLQEKQTVENLSEIKNNASHINDFTLEANNEICIDGSQTDVMYQNS